jgi:hypothetical protein
MGLPVDFLDMGFFVPVDRLEDRPKKVPQPFVVLSLAHPAARRKNVL